jgi:glutathione S-transferase
VPRKRAAGQTTATIAHDAGRTAAMITLYSFPGFGTLPSLSPFCFKMETYLKLTKRDYRTVFPAAPNKAPKGKLPYIEDQGRVVGDSGFIIDYLKATYGDPLDDGMSATEQATAHAFRRLFEENFYWCMVYARWFDAANWDASKRAIFAKMPLPLRLIAPPLVRRSLWKQIRGHGMGRHAQAEVYKIALDDLTAASRFLGDKPYFMGDRPRTIDATAHAFLALFLFSPINLPNRAEIDKLGNLKPYCERMHRELFGAVPSA